MKRRFVLLAILLFATFRVFSESKEVIDTSEEPQLVIENSLWKAKAWGKGKRFTDLKKVSEEGYIVGFYYYSKTLYPEYFSDYAYVQMEMKLEGVKGQKSEICNLITGGSVLIVYYDTGEYW